MAAAVASSPAQEDEFYTKILALRDAAISGTHPTFRLPADAIEQLKASLVVPESPKHAASQLSAPHGVGSVQTSIGTTNPAPQQNMPYPAFPGLSYNGTASTNGYGKVSRAQATTSGLDPIFLEKSDSLVRAEGALKRQRIERDLLEQAEKIHKHGRDKELLVEAPSTINIDAALAAAQKRVAHVSGLKPVNRSAGKANSVASSFDENDYYSSKAGSAWSVTSSPGRQRDAGVGAFIADFESLASKPSAKVLGKRPAYEKDSAVGASVIPGQHPELYHAEPDGMEEADDEDEDYSPPDPTAFDSFREEDTAADLQDTGIDEDSEYEPGEVTHETAAPSLARQQISTYSGPQGPIIRNNHLTHIAAPQPNRVSPLAIQKRPSLELELVNGCPVVKQPEQPPRQQQPKQKGIKRKVPTRSRASSGSPAGTQLSKRPRATAPLSKKEKKKQERQEKHLRKMEKTNKKKAAVREQRQADQSPPSPKYAEPYATQPEPYIKPEPVSPQPFSNVPEAQPFGYGYPPQHGPIEIDDSPHHASQPRYVYASAPRQEYAPQAPSPTVVRVQSPGGYRPVQRDTQDLRRVASMQYASRPPSPPQPTYSPVAQYSRHVSMAPPAREYGYREEAPALRYAPVEAQPEPLRLQEYRETSPAMMPPPSAAPRRIVVDQYGNRYYAAEPAPNPRASVAPIARAPEPDAPYDRAPSRMSVAYAQPPQPARYEQVDSRMPPPPPPARRALQQEAPPVEYVDTNGYRVREYSTRPADTSRYSVAPTSPVYQQTPQYEAMPPPPPRRAPQYEQMQPPPAPQEPTSPVYAPQPPQRAYSVRPESYNPTYAPRQASVAPVQYAPSAAGPPSARAASVAPRADYGAPVFQERAASYAPQPAVRYVDEYGREVVPREVRQAGGYGY